MTDISIREYVCRVFYKCILIQKVANLKANSFYKIRPFSLFYCYRYRWCLKNVFLVYPKTISNYFYKILWKRNKDKTQNNFLTNGGAVRFLVPILNEVNGTPLLKKFFYYFYFYLKNKTVLIK